MDEEGHRHVQPKIYTVKKKHTAIAPKHLLLTFQIGLGLYIHLCQQISPPLSPQYPVLTLTQIITLALSLKKLLFAPTA